MSKKQKEKRIAFTVKLTPGERSQLEHLAGVMPLAAYMVSLYREIQKDSTRERTKCDCLQRAR